MKAISKRKNIISYCGGGLFIAIFAIICVHLLTAGHAATSLAPAPTSPPVSWCEDNSFPGDQGAPASAPAGAVTVPAGNNSNVNLETANTTYWFAPGTHTGVSVQPNNNDTYIGAPGAILDGQGSTADAFVADYQAPYYTGVTIEYLTIQNYHPDGSNAVVNVNGGPGWTVKNNSIKNNVPGAAMMDGNNMVIQNNCLANNGQYAINGYSYDADSDPGIASSVTGGPHDITVSGNEISYNNTCNWDAVPSFPITIPSGCGGISRDCGCAGGAKFWQNQNVTISGNYVHDNYGDPGLWPDTGNDGFTITGNYISNNYGQGIFYEVSYNALIENNTFVNNGNGEGPTNSGFPTGAIYVSESGGDSRVPTAANIGTLTISGNVFTDNWDGVVLWENSDRFCGGNHVYGQPDGICTMVNPSVLPLNDTTTCVTKLENSATNKSTNNPDYFDLCRWKTQNVEVSNNTFNFAAANIGSKCTTNTVCGENALFSNYGSGSNGIPYTGAVVPINVTFNQNNVFKNNVYNGAWRFFTWAQSNLANPISWTQWSSAVTDKCSTSSEQSSGTCNSGFGQDAGSTFNSQAAPAPTPTVKPTVPTNVTATASSSTSVKVSWAASTDTGGPGVAGYYIFRNGSQIASVSGSTTTYNDTSVSAATQYSYAVEAFDNASPVNVSGLSTAASVQTPGSVTQPNPTTVLPGAPTNVTATANGPTSVTVNWAASTESGSSTSSTSSGGSVTPSSNISCNYQTDTWGSNASKDNYSVSKLSSKDGNPASFSVQLNASKGNTEVVGYPSDQCLLYSTIPSNLSSSYSITPPASSSGLDYEYAYDIWLTDATDAQQATWNNMFELMIWNYVSGQQPAGSPVATLPDGSKIWFTGGTSAGNTVSVVLPKNQTTGTIDIASLISQLKSLGYVSNSDNGIYDVEYGIEAPYGGGQTFTVNSVSVSENASSSTGGTTTTSTPSIAGYYVLRNGVNITPSPVTGTSYTDTSVVANTSYNYTVEAVDTTNNVSVQSAAATVKTPNPADTTPPSQPAGLTANAVSASQINLQWTASTDNVGVAGYQIYRNSQLVSTVQTTSYGDAGLSASTKYSYYIVAVDGAGNKSTQSATASATTQANPTTGGTGGTGTGTATLTTVGGKVTDSKTGAPLANVYVHTGIYGTSSGMAFTFTDANGNYVLSNITPNKSHYYSYSLRGYRSTSFSTKLQAGVTIKNVTLTKRISGSK